MKGVRWLLRRSHRLLYKLIKWHYGSSRSIRKKGIRLTLLPSVFHPGLYHSTDVLLHCIEAEPVEGCRILELGAGSGFITFYLKKHFNTVAFASDINPDAIAGLQMNATDLGLEVRTYLSDLFDDIPTTQGFDYVLVNPPYYPADPSDPDEFAFFAGSDFGYFHKFFKQLHEANFYATKVLMVLSDDLEMDSIHSIAQQNECALDPVHQEKKWGEGFTVYIVDLSGPTSAA